MSVAQETIDRVWSRALDFDTPGDAAYPGDAALHTLLVFHGTVLNGGLWNGIESHMDDEDYPIDAIVEAYRFFDLESAAATIERAATEYETLLLNEDGDVDEEAFDEAEMRIDESYHLEDAAVEEALALGVQQDPDAFAPVD